MTSNLHASFHIHCTALHYTALHCTALLCRTDFDFRGALTGIRNISGTHTGILGSPPSTFIKWTSEEEPVYHFSFL